MVDGEEWGEWEVAQIFGTSPGSWNSIDPHVVLRQGKASGFLNFRKKNVSPDKK